MGGDYQVAERRGGYVLGAHCSHSQLLSHSTASLTHRVLGLHDWALLSSKPEVRGQGLLVLSLLRLRLRISGSLCCERGSTAHDTHRHCCHSQLVSRSQQRQTGLTWSSPTPPSGQQPCHYSASYLPLTGPSTYQQQASVTWGHHPPWAPPSWAAQR